MPSPLALVLDEDPVVRLRLRERLARSGIEAIAVGSPLEALDVLRVHPFVVVVTTIGDSPTAMRRDDLETLCRLRADSGREASTPRILGRSDASEVLRRRVQALALSQAPVLFTGEAGSGRRYAARCLHALSGDTGALLVVPPAERTELSRILAERRGTVFVGSIEELAWPEQEALAIALVESPARPRVLASTMLDPHRAAADGRLSKPLVAGFGEAIVRVPALRERPADVAVLVRTFIEELRRLNGLPPLAVAQDALAALEAYRWPENVGQLQNAVESAVILAADGVVRISDLPEVVARGAAQPSPAARVDGRFRDAKRTVVEAFERSYLEELLKRHGGNVTGAAEQSGMLRSALQRLLRKHALRSADFRPRGASAPSTS